MILLSNLALLFLTALPAQAPDTVRISLFSLFKPETLQVRVDSGDHAILDASGLPSSRYIARGELIQIRLSGDQLNLVVGNSPGAFRESVITTEARIVPDVSGTLELILPGRIKRTVRGTVSVEPGLSGRGPIRILLTTSREPAVAAVVAAETSRREPEALMAIAVIVRTFMLSHAGRHSGEGFDFCDTTHCQLYRGEQDLADRVGSAAVSRAVARTAGQILTFEGRPAEGYYTAACGGLSATPSMVWGGSSSYPYRRVVCRWCKPSRFNRWERTADASHILDSLSTFLAARLSPATELITNRDQRSGFVRSVTLRDGSKQVELSADAFRRAIGQRLGWNTVLSPTFTVERRGSRFIFRGRGFGSQIGLCEEGAVAQAAAGRGYRDILRFYYPDADISEQPAHE